jgi:hypothetical protein
MAQQSASHDLKGLGTVSVLAVVFLPSFFSFLRLFPPSLPSSPSENLPWARHTFALATQWWTGILIIHLPLSGVHPKGARKEASKQMFHFAW